MFRRRVLSVPQQQKLPSLRLSGNKMLQYPITTTGIIPAAASTVVAATPTLFNSMACFSTTRVAACASANASTTTPAVNGGEDDKSGKNNKKKVEEELHWVGAVIGMAVALYLVEKFIIPKQPSEPAAQPCDHQIMIGGQGPFCFTDNQQKRFILALRERFGDKLVDEFLAKHEDPSKLHLDEKTLAAFEAFEQELLQAMVDKYGAIPRSDGDFRRPLKWEPGQFPIENVLPGDIVIFGGTGAIAALVKWGESMQFHGSHWEHGGMVWDQIKAADGKVTDVVLAEVTSAKQVPDYYAPHHKYKSARTIPLSQKIQGQGYEHIAVRRLKPEVREKLNISSGPQSAEDSPGRKTMWKVLKELQDPDLPFQQWSGWKGFWTSNRAALDKDWNRNVTWKSCIDSKIGVFCTQFVSEIYYRWNIVPSEKSKELGLVSSAQWTPPMFTSHYELVNEFYLPEEFVYCPPHMFHFTSRFEDRLIEMMHQINGYSKWEADHGQLV